MSSVTSGLGAGRFGRFEILLAERRLLVDGQPVNLGSRAFDLLAALVTRRERVVAKDELIDLVWPGLVVEDNNLQVQISALRKVLGAPAIATVPGRGYQFTVAATGAGTAVAAPAPLPRASEPAAAAGRGRSRLLVADDNKVNRLLLCRSLELMGHDVTTVENGRVALQRLQAEPFDLLLLDLEMPELDGFGLLEQRAGDAALREVPVIVTSSLEGVAAIARCIELGADDYLHKPVNPLLLKARVDASVERKLLRDRERELLARLAPGGVAGAATASADGRAWPGQRVEATVLAARVRNIEAWMAAQPVADTLELLSRWTTLMLDAVEGLGGRLARMTGDGLVAVFGAGAAGAGGEAAATAARAAIEMRELTLQLRAEGGASSPTAPVLEVGIGLASGWVAVGQAGSTRRSAWVCIGAPVQRALQLEALDPGAGGMAALIDGATQLALGTAVSTEALPSVVLPGSPKAVPVHALQAAAA